MRDDNGDDAATAFLERTACHIEQEMLDIMERWSAVSDESRGEVLARLARSAPQVVRLLCPSYGRFAAH
jgi:hypothetical protein